MAKVWWGLLVGASLLQGCPGGRCNFTGDCPAGSFCDQEVGRCLTECFSTDDCKNQPGCASSPEGCEALGVVCLDGRCQGESGVGPEDRVGEDDDGWDSPAFSGEIFVIDALALASSGIGFDLVGSSSRLIDNRLAALAPFSNPPVAQGLEQGVTLVIVEIAGLVADYDGEDYAVTVKFYAAEDADALSYNNFRAPRPGEPCCTFRVLDSALTNGEIGERQAVTRARARIAAHELRSLGPFSVTLQLDVGNPQPANIRIENAKLRLDLPTSLARIEAGVLGGAVPMSTLGLIDSPYCRNGGASCPPVSDHGTLLDIVSALAGRADIDLDDDGLECVFDSDGDMDFDRCCQGVNAMGVCVAANMCANQVVESADPSDPQQCLLRQGFDDGYSAALELTAVKAYLQ